MKSRYEIRGKSLVRLIVPNNFVMLIILLILDSPEKQQRRYTKYNQLRFFSFYYQTCTYELSERKRERKGGWRRLSLLTLTGAEVRICDETSSAFLLRWFLVENIPGYLVFRRPTQICVITSPAYTLHMDMTHSNMPPTQYTWSCFILVCHPCNLWGISIGIPGSV